MSNRAPLIGVLVALLLGVGFWFLLYQPRNDELEEIRAETAQLETQRSQLENEVRRLEDIQAREVEYRAALARLEHYIPAGISQSAVVRDLQVAADESGVTIMDLSFAEPEPVDEAPPTGTPGTVLGELPVTFTVDGGYFQMVDFMRRIEVDVARAILVDNVAITESDANFPVLTTVSGGRMFAVIPDVAAAEAEEQATGDEDGTGDGANDGDGDSAAGDGDDEGDVS